MVSCTSNKVVTFQWCALMCQCWHWSSLKVQQNPKKLPEFARFLRAQAGIHTWITEDASAYAILSILWRYFFLICIVPVKTLLSVTFKFALFFVMLLFRILPETTRVGESRKPKIDSFSIHAWTSETSSMPSWSHGAKCGSRISASSNTIVRWGRMKSLCLENLEKWWEM